MKEIKVLGSGCTKCLKTAEFIDVVARDCGVAVDVQKETSPEVMMSYGVMGTPAVVVDNVLVHSGSIPSREKVKSWLSAEG
jgi:hypothetical protein